MHNLCWFYIEILIFQSLNSISEIDSKLLKFFTAEIHDIRIEDNSNFFNSFLFFRLFFLVIGLSWLWGFFNFHFYHFAGLTLISWWIFGDESCQSVFVVQLSNKRTGITLAIYLITVNGKVHFWEFALGTADIFFDEFI